MTSRTESKARRLRGFAGVVCLNPPLYAEDDESIRVFPLQIKSRAQWMCQQRWYRGRQTSFVL
jgi:hypothetical protein